MNYNKPNDCWFPGGKDNLLLLGLEPDDITQVEVLRRRPQHAVYGIRCHNHRYILKWFDAPSESIEVQAYRLLGQYGVPTLPVYAATDQGLLMADLRYSQQWQLATEPDVSRAEVGTAVANWYRILHKSGQMALKDKAHINTMIRDWVGELTPQSLSAAGEKLGLHEEAVWLLSMAQIEPLKRAFHALPQTFNYNDFAAENLAISRNRDAPLKAIIFDYDQFSLGPAYSDWRNVMSTLRGSARAAFVETYGEINESEKLLDDPLSILHGLVIASRRARFPNWAITLAEMVKNGKLERRIRRAMELMI